MTANNNNGDPKPGFGRTDDPQNYHGSANSEFEKEGKDTGTDRSEEIEDTSANNYGNIGKGGGVDVEGEVEDEEAD